MSILDRVLIYDVETTTYSKGSPFDNRNKLVMSGFKWLGDEANLLLSYNHFPTTQDLFDDSTLIVGFNIKFDLHWARRIGVNISKVCVWDCQIGEFLLNKQTPRYPSLDQACEKYGIPLKLDVVKTEYWDKGICTSEVPTEILQEYLEGDLDRTERVFKEQIKQFKGIDL